MGGWDRGGEGDTAAADWLWGVAEDMGEVAGTNNERWKFYSSGKTKEGHVVEVSGGRRAELEARTKGESDVNTEGDSRRSICW